MERRNILILTITGILAVVVGLTVASLLGVDIGFLSGSIITNSPYPP
ncbi:MAG TPA: hypothetical protein HA263_07010 [Methanoregulaceae archaeon]|nr:hypothetical protein [Methanoregulaceae archaeon]